MEAGKSTCSVPNSAKLSLFSRPALLCAAAFSLVINILMLTGSLYMMQIYDRVLSSQSGETLVFLTLIALGSLAVMTLVDLARGRVTAGVGVWLEQHLGQLTLERAIGDTIAGRDYRAEALRDLATLRGFMAGPALITLFDTPWAPIYLALVYILHPTLGHVALAGTALLLGFAILNDLWTRHPTAVAGRAGLAAQRIAEFNRAQCGGGRRPGDDERARPPLACRDPSRRRGAGDC